MKKFLAYAVALAFGFAGAGLASAQVTTGSLTVTKVVNGGPNVAGDFTIFLDGVPITSGVATTTLSAGVHTVTETNMAGYTASFSGDCTAAGQVTISAGATSTCVITNNFTATTSALTVNKVVVGGPNVLSDFSLFLNGMPITSGVATTTLSPGTYTVTETSRAGYTAIFSGACNASGQVTLAAGASGTCVVTNIFAQSTGQVQQPGATNPPVVTPLGAQTPDVPSTGGGSNGPDLGLLPLGLLGLVAALGAGLLFGSTPKSEEQQ